MRRAMAAYHIRVLDSYSTPNKSPLAESNLWQMKQALTRYMQQYGAANIKEALARIALHMNGTRTLARLAGLNPSQVDSKNGAALARFQRRRSQRLLQSRGRRPVIYQPGERVLISAPSGRRFGAKSNWSTSIYEIDSVNRAKGLNLSVEST